MLQTNNHFQDDHIGLDASAYFHWSLTRIDRGLIKRTITTAKNGDILVFDEPIHEGINLQGYWCSEEFAKELLDIRCKKDVCRTPYERDLLNTAYEFFYSHMDDCESFVDWINYKRFIDALDDDFFGRD